MSEFIRADSTNLPHMDLVMILNYYHDSDKHNAAEIRGAKALLSSRDGYVENNIGYVEIQRNDTECILRAKVVPETKLRKKNYIVTVEIDEKNNKVIDATCDNDDCPASAGGCKHSLAVLYWLLIRAIEPSPTSVQCYWAKPRASSEGTEPVFSKDIFPSKKRAIELGPRDPERMKVFYEECKKRKLGDSLILNMLPDHDTGLLKYCVFDMILEFTTKSDNHSYENFKTEMSIVLTQIVQDEIEINTKKQAESKLWHSIRQGRITASKIYDACRCRTTDGSLVEQILGGYKMYDTKAMKRGKQLEKPVVREIEKKLGVKIEECGFYLINLFCGASPDGIANNFIIEIKCPTTVETSKNYIDNNKIKDKFLAQCQLQMLATGKKKCAFCIADPDFEQNKNIKIIWVKFDATYTNNLLQKAEQFWKDTIYPIILRNALS
ncbi:uncharacterized protein LOC134675637 [Cydia fagiglandana]|uniref:uncharacterized protein LOC134675637 n=1 Tax=Cydia fagiglandana TaxID=1458189 RepID=UPI002FEE0653